MQIVYIYIQTPLYISIYLMLNVFPRNDIRLLRNKIQINSTFFVFNPSYRYVKNLVFGTIIHYYNYTLYTNVHCTLDVIQNIFNKLYRSIY